MLKRQYYRMPFFFSEKKIHYEADFSNAEDPHFKIPNHRARCASFSIIPAPGKLRQGLQ